MAKVVCGVLGDRVMVLRAEDELGVGRIADLSGDGVGGCGLGGNS